MCGHAKEFRGYEAFGVLPPAAYGGNRSEAVETTALAQL
jgi:hypothetical protein